MIGAAPEVQLEAARRLTYIGRRDGRSAIMIRRLSLRWLIPVATCALGPVAPSIADDPTPAAAETPATFPEEFSILMSRSMFGRPRKLAGGPATRPASGKSEPAFVLRGVAVQGKQRTALVEDEAGHHTMQVHEGDSLLGGRVLAIAIDGLDRAVAGHITHVGIGQRLDNAPGGPIPVEEAPPRPTAVAHVTTEGAAMPAAAQVGPAPTTQPVNSPTPAN
jgi:hypothetical protein